VILLSGEAEHNNAAGAHLYAERYPQQQYTNHRTSFSLECDLQETGHVEPNVTDSGRSCSACCRTIRDTSNRQSACHHHISQRMVVSAFHDQLLYPVCIHVQAVQLSLDYERQKVLCERLLQRAASSPTFLSQVLLMDQACFT
jgi:hypothetical protein